MFVQSLPASANVATAAHLHPYAQGRLDGLCGVYAIINAVRLAAPLDHQLEHGACEQLFRQAVSLIDPLYLLRTSLVWGFTRQRWQALLNRLSRLPIAGGRAIVITRLTGPSVASLHELLIERAIRAHRPVLGLLRGTYDHFTVVSGYTPTRLILFDSWGYHWVERRSCGVGRATPCRHRIAVKSVQTLEVL